MPIGKTLSVTTRAQWRAWLKENYAAESEIWLLNPKKHTKLTRVEYDDAVEEALCFGWIDSQERRVDDEFSAIRFSPRKKNSTWSDSNIARMERLLQTKKVLPEVAAAYRAATTGRGTKRGRHPAGRMGGSTPRRR